MQEQSPIVASGRFKLAAIAVLGALVALALLLFSGPFRGVQEAGRAGQLGALHCTPEADFSAAYRLQVETQLRFNAASLLGSANGASQIVKSGAGLVGRLRTRAVERRDAGMLLAFRLDQLEGSAGSIESDPELRKQLAEPFFAVVEPSCRLRSFGFAKHISPEVTNRLQGLLQGLSVSLRGSQNHDSWATQEWDGTGLFTAVYHRTSAARSFKRQRVSYIRAHASSFGVSDGVAVRVVESNMQSSMDSSDAWFERSDAAERLQITREKSGDFVADLSITIRLQRSTEAVDATEFASAHEDLSWRDESSPPLASEVRDPEPPAGMKSLPLDQALAQFAAMYHSGQGLHAIDFLKLYLRARPEMASELIALIERRQIPSELEPAVFHALERANTPQAHLALLSALSNRHTTDNRARAAAALPDIAQPDRRTLDGLRGMAASGRGENQHETNLVRNAGAFALGRLENRVRNSDPELAQQTRDEIRGSLQRANNVEQRAALLDAIGNSGNPEFLSDVRPMFKSDSSLLRMHSIQSLEHMPPAATEGLFRDILEQEADPQVRAAIATTFADQARRANAVAPGGVLDGAIDRLGREPDPHVRAALIQLIGPACATQEPATQALVGQFAREPEPQLLKLIGKFVPASKLGA